jgi:enamidase
MTWDGTFGLGDFGPPEGSLELRNLRGVVSGRLGTSLLEAETLRVEAGVVAAVGAAPVDADVVVDARGAVAVPGLIDTHCHVVLGDYTPRQHAVGFLESYLHGGVTQVMSASEVHLPGRPSDRARIKALAIAAQRAWSAFRPGGMKVRGGSLICEPTLEREDFAALAAEGVRYMKVGFGAFRDPADAAPLVGWAREAGFVVMSHTGGASIPGSSPITVDHLLAMNPTIAGHANGGTTCLPDRDLERLVASSRMALQIVQAGNLRSALHLLRTAAARGQLGRVICGTDTPSGTGVMPLGLLKTIAELSSLGGLEAADALALATGNAGAVLGVEEGILEPSRPADLILLQEPLGGSRPDPLAAIAIGDIPGIAGVVVDGAVRVLRSRNTPAPAREVTVKGRRSVTWPR